VTFPAWKTREDFEAWWREHGRDYRALSVSDPKEWERGAKLIEAFQTKNRGY